MSINISRLQLDPLSRMVQLELINPYEMHRTLCHAFPGLAEEQYKSARVLFRIDAEKNDFQLLVQSKIEPDWSAFANHLAGRRYLQHPPQVKRLDPNFQAGHRFRFRLMANPTYRPFIAKANKTVKHVDRRGLFREYERLDWLLHRGRREYGFDFETYELEVRPTRRSDGSFKVAFRGQELDTALKLEVPAIEVTDLNDGRRFPWSKGEPRTPKDQFSAARFDGVLTVTDPEKFKQAFENGIGPAKGYGFGLLSLARA